MRPALEVADIFRRHGAAYRADHAGSLTSGQRRVMAAIEVCRTAALGGHVERCEDCGETRIAYNSCRNRHCPKCQGLARAQWLSDRQGDLLPVPYFHVVFTVPAPIASIALQNKAVVYDILFRAAAETVQTIAADPKHLGATIGMTAVLHTWGQNLFHHPHVHCIVPGGGLSPEGRWVACRPGFLLSVRVLSRLFRRLFLERVRAAFNAGMLDFFGELVGLAKPAAFAAHLRALRSVEWVVYAKRPFGGPQQVLDYLGRYTHRVAIANTRLIGVVDGEVRFRWKDYRHPQRPKIMTLPVAEFIRRFMLHVLPDGFRRIRHFGFLANAHRSAKLAVIRGLLQVPEPVRAPEPVDYRERYARLFGLSLDICPACGGHLVEIAVLKPAARPFRCDSS
ncbi:MAG TPA: IS91 family transposase [Xanthobacteraceae bacterium]|nr:IS91 family transposase [Xanthobacteraceae bacterium]